MNIDYIVSGIFLIVCMFVSYFFGYAKAKCSDEIKTTSIMSKVRATLKVAEDIIDENIAQKKQEEEQENDITCGHA